MRERRLAERKRLLEPRDELFLAERAIRRRTLRRRDARGLAAQEVVAFVSKVDLDLREAHLRRCGPIGVLVRRHRLGGSNQNARIPLLRLAQRVRNGTRRRRSRRGRRGGGSRRLRRLGGERPGQNGARNQQHIRSNPHGTPPMKRTTASKFTAWVLCLMRATRQSPPTYRP